MAGTTVSIAEGKKGFSRIIHDSIEKKEEIIITKRGKPVAVIIPYDEYRRTLRREGYGKIMKTRKAFQKAGIQADDVYKESRNELEKRP
jgi:prevent-host-death family protein